MVYEDKAHPDSSTSRQFEYCLSRESIYQVSTLGVPTAEVQLRPIKLATYSGSSGPIHHRSAKTAASAAATSYREDRLESNQSDIGPSASHCRHGAALRGHTRHLGPAESYDHRANHKQLIALKQFFSCGGSERFVCWMENRHFECRLCRELPITVRGPLLWLDESCDHGGAPDSTIRLIRSLREKGREKLNRAAGIRRLCRGFLLHDTGLLE